jgi:hypothetical protein
MRRIVFALLVAAAFAGSAFAADGKISSAAKQKEVPVIEAAPFIPLTLSALFVATGAYEVQADGTTFIPAVEPSVMVARVNSDGTISTACVTTEKAARAFMERQSRDNATAPAPKE